MDADTLVASLEHADSQNGMLHRLIADYMLNILFTPPNAYRYIIEIFGITFDWYFTTLKRLY